jgi:hypothetical protein
MGQKRELDLCLHRLWIFLQFKESAPSVISKNTLRKFYSPSKCPANRANPIPRGARKVARCFSTASIKIVRINWAVNIISINRPCHFDVSLPSVVATVKDPGNRPTTMPDAAMPAAN